ncbi:MAG: MotA/TolQ/ExbB proton channel family protein [Deltaproteobacteria bacterium]|nr:MotA/TolQ/ExbB proton channel family protein [Deltaproteobacteria bacterium]
MEGASEEGPGNAPFIGLFGTVLGIIQAFGVLASNPSESSAIMFSLAEALVATAVGLFVAIPAVVAHNVFAKRIRGVVNECESMRDHLVSVRFAEEG